MDPTAVVVALISAAAVIIAAVIKANAHQPRRPYEPYEPEIVYRQAPVRQSDDPIWLCVAALCILALGLLLLTGDIYGPEVPIFAFVAFLSLVIAKRR